MIPIKGREPSTRRLFFQAQHNEENEGGIRDEGWSPRDSQNQVRGNQASSIKKIQYQSTTLSLSTQRPSVASLRWSKEGPTSKKVRTQLGKPIQGHGELRHWSYKLQELDEKTVQRTWNATYLKFYFSWSTTSLGMCSFSYSSLLSQKKKKLGFLLKRF